jgi:hypothetical protein
MQTDNSSFGSPSKTVLLYPCPALDKLNIHPSIPGVELLEIFNMLGDLVLTQTSGTTMDHRTLDVSSFPSGLYIVRMITGERTACGKFIKQ